MILCDFITNYRAIITTRQTKFLHKIKTRLEGENDQIVQLYLCYFQIKRVQEVQGFVGSQGSRRSKESKGFKRNPTPAKANFTQFPHI